MWVWLWSNILPNSSVFQCACGGMNLEICGRGPNLMFRPAVLIFCMHFVVSMITSLCIFLCMYVSSVRAIVMSLEPTCQNWRTCNDEVLQFFLNSPLLAPAAKTVSAKFPVLQIFINTEQSFVCLEFIHFFSSSPIFLLGELVDVLCTQSLYRFLYVYD